MKTLILSFLALSLSACAGTGTYSLAEQCGHNPGCITTMRNRASELQQVRAIEPQNAGRWEPVLPRRKK